MPILLYNMSLNSALLSLAQAHRVGRGSGRHVRYSNAPTQSSAHDSCVKLRPPTPAPTMSVATWGISLEAQQAPHTTRQREPGELRSTRADTLPIVWVAQTCCLSRVSPTGRHPGTGPTASAAIHCSDLFLSLSHTHTHTHTRCRPLALSPLEGARHLAASEGGCLASSHTERGVLDPEMPHT